MNMQRLPVQAESLETRDILGVRTTDAGWDEALSLLRRLIEERRFQRVGFLNANNANIAVTNPGFRAALEDFLILPDGVGVDIAAKLGSKFEANLNGTDLVPALLQTIPNSLKVALIGARRSSIDEAAKTFAGIAPQHSYTVIHDGFFDTKQEPGILSTIAALHPDILLVAMGVPRQEIWIAEKLTGRHCTMPIAVGALFDLVNGTVPRAPGWMRTLRMEWVFRLLAEPKRLWRRYLVGNPLFLMRVAHQKLGREGRY